MNYRKLYEEHHGIKIPKGMHIHHIDGNHDNNSIENLEMLTPDAHAANWKLGRISWRCK